MRQLVALVIVPKYLSLSPRCAGASVTGWTRRPTARSPAAPGGEYVKMLCGRKIAPGVLAYSDAEVAG
jgi:hypothetical protein